MRHFFSRFTALIILGLCTSTAEAVDSCNICSVPIPADTIVINPNSTPAGLTSLNGWNTLEVWLHTDSDWTAAAMLLELTTGSIFQEGEGFAGYGVTLGQPDPGGFPFLPSMEFDSYIFDPHGGAAIAGAGGDVGGDIQQFDSQELDISWTSHPTDTADVGDFPIARITLSPDANGMLTVAFTTAGSPGKTEVALFIDNGGFTLGACIPEPTSLALLSLGGLAVLRRR